MVITYWEVLTYVSVLGGAVKWVIPLESKRQPVKNTNETGVVPGSSEECEVCLCCGQAQICI